MGGHHEGCGRTRRSSSGRCEPLLTSPPRAAAVGGCHRWSSGHRVVRSVECGLERVEIGSDVLGCPLSGGQARKRPEDRRLAGVDVLDLGGGGWLAAEQRDVGRPPRTSAGVRAMAACSTVARVAGFNRTVRPLIAGDSAGTQTLRSARGILRSDTDSAITTDTWLPGSQRLAVKQPARSRPGIAGNRDGVEPQAVRPRASGVESASGSLASQLAPS